MKKYRQIVFCLIFAVMNSTIGCIPKANFRSYITPSPKISILHTPETVKRFRLIWIVENAFVLWNIHNPTIGAEKGKICYLGDYRKEANYRNITCFNSKNGSVLWQNVSGSDLVLSPDGVFVGFAGPAEVRKYDPNSGNLIWKKQLSGNGCDFLYAINGQIQVLTTTGRGDFWILDEDGNKINQLNGETIYVSLPDVTYIHVIGLEAHSTKTKDLLWKYIDPHLERGPLFTEKTILLRNGDFLGRAYALDRGNGSLLWTLDNIASNEVYDPLKQVVYMLDTDGNLISVQERTGSKTVIAKIATSPLTFGGQNNLSYHVAYDTDERILFVAMGDSHQIFAFAEE